MGLVRIFRSLATTGRRSWPPWPRLLNPRRDRTLLIVQGVLFGAAISRCGCCSSRTLGGRITSRRGGVPRLHCPRAQPDTVLWLVGALCFLPPLSPISLAAVPLLLERMLRARSRIGGDVLSGQRLRGDDLRRAAVDRAARLGRWASLARDRYAARHAESGSAESEVASRLGLGATAWPGGVATIK